MKLDKIIPSESLPDPEQQLWHLFTYKQILAVTQIISRQQTDPKKLHKE